MLWLQGPFLEPSTTTLAGQTVCATQSRFTQLSIEPLLLPQATEAANVCQSEGEAEPVFVTHIGDSIASIFQCHAAAIPVVSGLRADELQLLGLRVKTKTAGATEAALVRPAISQGHAKLVEGLGLG